MIGSVFEAEGLDVAGFTRQGGIVEVSICESRTLKIIRTMGYTEKPRLFFFKKGPTLL